MGYLPPGNHPDGLLPCQGLQTPAAARPQGLYAYAGKGAPWGSFFPAAVSRPAGIAVGLAAYILLLHFFSQRIWAIDVIGNEKLSDREILSVLEPMGVELGKISENLDIPNIQLIALQKIPTWPGWPSTSAAASPGWRSRNAPFLPQPTDPNRPSNIRAARDGPDH